MTDIIRIFDKPVFFQCLQVDLPVVLKPFAGLQHVLHHSLGICAVLELRAPLQSHEVDRRVPEARTLFLRLPPSCLRSLLRSYDLFSPLVLPFPGPCRRGDLRAAFAAGAAPAAGPTACTVAAAGAFARLFIVDHAADQKADDQNDDRNQNDIDEIGTKPFQHRITSFKRGGSAVRKEGQALTAPPYREGRKITAR